MGSCASVHKDDVGLPKEGKKGGAPVGDVLVDLKRKIEEQHAGFGASKNHDSGSKDEMFFESQGWLESDCDDDFLSVNGDDSKSSEPSPTGRRKLAELLQEALQNGREENNATGEPDSSKDAEQPAQSVAPAGKTVSEPSSGCSTEPTPAREGRIRKERAWYTGHCCLPPFVHSLTLEDEGRQKTGPVAV